MRYSVKRKLIGLALTTLTTASVAGVGAVGVVSVQAMNQFQQNEENQIFEETKVKEDVDYYGGDQRYVDTKINIFTPFTENKTKYCNHLDPEHNGPIIVGYDKSTVSEATAEQFNHTFDHLNYLFNVINPNYKFETGYYDKDNCDIYVDFTKMNLSSRDKMYSAVGAYVDWKFDTKNTSVLESATIHFNNSINFATPELRYYMLHEMMHVLYGSNDVNWEKSPTFSVYNYCDVDFIIRQISCAYESIEDYKNGTIHSIGGHWKTMFDIVDSKGNSIGRPFLPLMTLEEKNSFVSMLPTDASTLVALYGDSSTTENRKAYIELLKEVLATNKKVFDIDYSQFGETSRKVTEQPYYDDDYTLPEI